ncbi:hypothetical protein GCM10011511_54980 [Puia dinghuensis]|uniref:Uncharacterized protein n=2 Tax=Puia dinghuensis TaxID=1792502 RepID=A0A8J2UJ16_9BACT|nr:hypothetical protein GCM10011511_54980 [Puia dinghuensis]
MTYDRQVIKIPCEQMRRIHAALNPDMSTLLDMTIQNADLTDPGMVYSQLLQQYIDGEHQPTFLRRLMMMASQVGDKPGWLAENILHPFPCP